ncbi:unnamed protein product, partial [Mesorhabditis spiculigera]
MLNEGSAGPSFAAPSTSAIPTAGIGRILSTKVVKVPAPNRNRIHTPYQNQMNPLSGTIQKKHYTINVPMPGIKPKEFPGIEGLREMKKLRRIAVVPTVPQSLSCETIFITQPLRNAQKTRYVLRIPKRHGGDQMAQPITIPQQHSPNEPIHWNDAPLLEYHCVHSQCFWKGKTEQEFTEHMRRRHPDDFDQKNIPASQKRSSGVRCSECDAIVYSRALLLKHMGTAHGIALPSFSRVFQTESDLQTWLRNVREAFCVDFVTGSGPKQWSSGARISYLVCSRTGDVKERRTKKFCRPTRSTIKCGKTCTAYLKTRKAEGEDELAPFVVEGCLYHTGHNIDPNRIVLTGEEMESICAAGEKFGEMVLNYPIHEIRELLGPTAPRFRLIDDSELLEVLPKWIEQSLEWKYKADRRTEADQLADTLAVYDSSRAAHEMNGQQISFGRQPDGYRHDQYSYELLEEDQEMSGILYESVLNPENENESEDEHIINVTDDFDDM